MKTLQRCELRFLYFGADGFAHFTADCGPCWTLEWAPTPSGPWYEDRQGVAGQDIPVEPSQGQRYYRVISRECKLDEQSELQ